MPRFAIGVALFLLASSQVDAQQVSTHAREAVQTIRELRAIELPDRSVIENGPPHQIPGLLRKLNRQLLALVIDTLNDSSRHTVPREEEITAQLRAVGWEEIPDHKWNAYGEIIRIEFDWKLGYEPDLLIVSPQLWIPCGSSDPDSAVYVFQGKARHWKLVLTADADFDSPGAASVSGLQYELSPPGTKGGWFLAIANAPPSCRWTSANLRYRILRPGVAADKPRILFDRLDPLDSKFDPPFDLRTEEDWFALTRGKTRKLDGEHGVSVARYEVDGERVTRIHPLALRPEDFLDEWVQLTWADAKHWSNKSLQPNLQGWHSRLNGLENDSTEMRFVQPCPNQTGSDSRWMINLWIDQKLNPSVNEENFYVLVGERNGIYYVDGIHINRPSGCPGEMPVARLTDWKLPDW
jgi:hypothetical protein